MRMEWGMVPTSHIPVWIAYGGRAWLPDSKQYTVVPYRVWPVVDAVMDNYGGGIIITLGGIDAVVMQEDLFTEEVDYV